MPTLFICTGKKKAVDKARTFFEELAQRKRIDLIACKQRSKKALFLGYEELKVLFRSDKGRIQIDRDLLRDLDFSSLKHQGHLSIRLVTPRSEDRWLKTRVMSMTAALQMRGGRVQIDEVVSGDSSERAPRQCRVAMTGPEKLAELHLEALIKEKLADPDTVEYVL